MAGMRKIREAIDAGELGRVAFIEANFSNNRELELTPKAWRWYKDKAPGGPLSELAIHQFDVLNYLGGEVAEASGMASKLSPVGAEVEDQSMTLLKFADGKIGYVGSCWTSPGIFSVRVFGSKGLMHYEIDFDTWDTPDQLHKKSMLYIQRGVAGYATSRRYVGVQGESCGRGGYVGGEGGGRWSGGSDSFDGAVWGDDWGDALDHRD